MKRSGFKKSGSTLKRSQKPKTALGRTKLPKVSTVRTKCDNLLTPLIKAMYPNCLLCRNETQVAHHHVHKSKSSRLRYELDNLIPLCGHCHVVLHNNESYWASKVVEIKGLSWFQSIDRKKNEYVKTDVHFYIENLARLEALKNAL